MEANDSTQKNERLEVKDFFTASLISTVKKAEISESLTNLSWHIAILDKNQIIRKASLDLLMRMVGSLWEMGGDQVIDPS